MLILAGLTLGGEDWQPKKMVEGTGKDEKVLYDERHNLRQAWGDMAVEYQWENLPAWLACAIATGAYVAPRINAPSTQARVSKFKLWWDSRKLKKQEAADAKARAKAQAEAEAKEKKES